MSFASDSPYFDDLRVCFMSAYRREVAQEPGGTPIGVVHWQGHHRWAAIDYAEPAAQQSPLFESADEAIRSLIGDPR